MANQERYAGGTVAKRSMVVKIPSQVFPLGAFLGGTRRQELIAGPGRVNTEDSKADRPATSDRVMNAVKA